MTRWRCIAAEALLAIALIAIGEAHAQYPNKPIHWVVPYPPGGITDNVTRMVTQKLQAALGQPVLVDNRPGGNSIIGTEAAAKAAPDGHTLFGAALPFSVIQKLYRTSFDVPKDIAGINAD